MMSAPRAIAVAAIVVTATMGSSAILRADEIYRTCIAASDGSNQSWLQCGNAFVDREKRKFESAWNTLINGQEGRTRDDLLAEHRAWMQFSELACAFYDNGDLGREGQVLSYPVCKARLYAERSSVLESYDEEP